MTWDPWLIALDVLTDATVAISYYSIPAALLLLFWRKKLTITLQPILFLFALFIALCGGGHLIDIISIWKPIYWVKGFWNAGTAIVSALTAIVLIPRTIEFLKMPENATRLEREAEDLREQRSFLQTVIDSVEEGIVLVDNSGRILLQNPAARELMEARPDLHISGNAGGLANPRARVASGRQIERFARDVPAYGRLCVMRDVTARFQAEQDRLRLDRMISTMQQGFAVVALADERIVTTNPSFDRMHGQPAGAMAGRPATEIFAGGEVLRRQVFDEIRAACEERKYWDGETSHRRANGTEFFCSTRCNLYSEDGNEFLSLIQHDITAEKLIESENQRVQARLLESAKLESLGVLAGGVAHDFNNLLTGILGNTSLALDSLPESSPAAPLLRNAIEATDRAARLTNQMLAYSGKGKFLIEPVRLTALAQETSRLVRHSVPRNVSIDIEGDPSAPFVEADVTQMQQMMMNLVINAAEAIGDAHGAVTIRGGSANLTAADISRRFPLFDLQPGDYAWLEVRDTGQGMDQRTLDRIFEPFFTTKATGRGLGLAAVQGIVRGHHGALHVESKPGVGSSFTAYLPALPAGWRPGFAPANVPANLAGTGTVLVVDDEDIVRATAVATLHSYGYRSVEARNGAEAVDIFDKHSAEIGLVLLDLTMPVMNGQEALEKLVEIDPAVPVLLTSGYTESVARERFAGKRISGFLQKPFAAMTLAEKVKSYARNVERS